MQENPQEYATQAVKEHQILIAQEPFRYESYHALFNIYRKSNQFDKAYSPRPHAGVPQAGHARGAADPRQVRHERVPAGASALPEEILRRHVFHPDEDLFLTGILGSIAPGDRGVACQPAARVPQASTSARTSTPTRAPVSPHGQVRHSSSSTSASRTSTSGRTTRAMSRCSTRSATVASTRRWSCSRTCSSARTRSTSPSPSAGTWPTSHLPHYAYVALDRSPQNLKQVFLACMHMCDMETGGNRQELDQIAREILSRLPGQRPRPDAQPHAPLRRGRRLHRRQEVGRSAPRSRAYRHRLPAVRRPHHRRAPDLPGQAGFGSAMTPKDKIKELVLYSISEDYFKARSIGASVAWRSRACCPWDEGPRGRPRPPLGAFGRPTVTACETLSPVRPVGAAARRGGWAVVGASDGARRGMRLRSRQSLDTRAPGRAPPRRRVAVDRGSLSCGWRAARCRGCPGPRRS